MSEFPLPYPPNEPPYPEPGVTGEIRTDNAGIVLIFLAIGVATYSIVKLVKPTIKASFIINNHSGNELRHADSTMKHGLLNLNPTEIIGPRKYGVFSAGNRFVSLGRGTEGTVTYKAADNARIHFQWNFPFRGSPSAVGYADRIHSRQYKIQALVKSAKKSDGRVVFEVAYDPAAPLAPSPL